MSRQSIDNYFMDIAKVVATRGTCVRRKVGCVLVNSRRHILATGYNGAPVGLPNCIEYRCGGESFASGLGLDTCLATHAEANSLLQCRDVYEIETAYCTASPCLHCVKLLMNTSCRRIVFAEKYPHGESEWLWVAVKRDWVWLNTASSI